MKYIIISLIYFSIFNIIICLNCDPKRNCLRANGYCSNDIGNCYPGFITYQIHKTKEIKYCTYEQTPKWIPLLLELLLPSTGHFYMGKIGYGLFKLSLLLIPVIILGLGMCFAIPIVESPLNLSVNVKLEAFCFYIPIFISRICYIIFALIHCFDILAYTFRYYTDENGIALY